MAKIFPAMFNTGDLSCTYVPDAGEYYLHIDSADKRQTMHIGLSAAEIAAWIDTLSQAIYNHQNGASEAASASPRPDARGSDTPDAL